VLTYRLHPRDHARLVPGVVVEHEHLDGVFAWIAAQQHDRDAERLTNPKSRSALTCPRPPARAAEMDKVRRMIEEGTRSAPA